MNKLNVAIKLNTQQNFILIEWNSILDEIFTKQFAINLPIAEAENLLCLP